MNWKKALLALALVAPVVALLWLGLQTNPRIVPSPLPGRPAPDFALEVLPPSPALDGAPGDTLRLASLRGQVVVLNFWASWCVPCRYEHPALTAAARAYADRPVRFVGVLYQDTRSNARAFLEEMGGHPYATVLDPGSRMAIDYGLTGVPETFFIAPDGRIAYKIFGPVTERELTERIDALLAGEAVAATP